MRRGELVTATRRITQDDFDRFAALTGDDNPIHVDPVFSATTRFGKTLCHGMLLYSLVSEMLRSRLGVGAVVVEHDLKFPGPAFADDVLGIRIEATGAHVGDGLTELSSVVTGPNGVVCCEARTVVRLGKET